VASGVVPGLVVGLREGIEAALVIGIILAYLTKIDQKPLRRYVYSGAGAATAASVVGAILFAILIGEFEGTAEQLFEGVAAILAVIVLTSMIFWMMKAAKDIRKHVEQRIDLLVDRRQVAGLASLAFVAVFREGIETVLFMAGLTGAGTTPGDVAMGVGIGLLVAAFVGYGLFAASWKINLRRFFQVTGIVLIIIAAGLFSLGVHELQEAGVLPWLSGTVYDLTAVFSVEANPLASVLRGLVGYSDAPTQLEVVAYFTYWAFAVLVYFGIRTGRISVVTRPLKSAWAAVKRSMGRTPATKPESD